MRKTSFLKVPLCTATWLREGTKGECIAVRKEPSKHVKEQVSSTNCSSTLWRCFRRS